MEWLPYVVLWGKLRHFNLKKKIHDSRGMKDYKLMTEMENMKKDPHLLSFLI